MIAHLLDEVVKEVGDHTGYGVLTGDSYRLQSSMDFHCLMPVVNWLSELLTDANHLHTCLVFWHHSMKYFWCVPFSPLVYIGSPF